jgi:hypothetical protein
MSSTEGVMLGPEERALEFGEREIVLRADFSNLDDECVWTPMRFMMDGPRHPREGEWVYLLDDTGRGCLGQVEAVNGWSARVRLDWGSWAPDGDLPPGAPTG